MKTSILTQFRKLLDRKKDTRFLVFKIGTTIKTKLLEEHDSVYFLLATNSRVSNNKIKIGSVYGVPVFLYPQLNPNYIILDYTPYIKR